MKNTLRALLGLLMLMASLSGCVGVSMHSMHPVRIAVTDSSAAAPAASLPLTVIYDYDSYGWFYLFNKPPEASAVTDDKGVAVMKLADFRYRILLKINGSVAALSKSMILEGGEVSLPQYKVVLRPE